MAVRASAGTHLTRAGAIYLIGHPDGRLVDWLTRATRPDIVLEATPPEDSHGPTPVPAHVRRPRRSRGLASARRSGHSGVRVPEGGDEGAAGEAPVRHLHLREHRHRQARLPRRRGRRPGLAEVRPGGPPALDADARGRA